MHERRRFERSHAQMTTYDEERQRGGSGCRPEMTIEALTEAEGSSGYGGIGDEVGKKLPPEVVYVKRGMLAKCLTCPLCHKLFRDATTIRECLHSFCRKCIYDKLTEEDLDCCPVCNIDLGVLPVEKLRPDHCLQNLRARLFPFKRKAETPEEPPITLPIRRKERSLSSLVVNTPRVTSSGLTGRRTKCIPRRASLCGSNSLITDFNAKYNKIDKLAENSCSVENPSKLSANKRQKCSSAEPSINTPRKDADNHEASFQDKVDLWKPLNCLVEVASRTKSYKSTPQSANTKTEKTNDPDYGSISNKIRVKEKAYKYKVQDESNDSAESPPATGKTKRLQGRKQKEGPNSAQALIDVASAQHDRRTSPIWFSLVASFDQSGDPPLPQIPTNYLRIKDVNVSVSFIQKYLVAKLNLASESEVEVTCRGQPVTMPLHNLVEQWLKGGPSHKLQATVGASAKDFVMVLAYGRPKVSTR